MQRADTNPTPAQLIWHDVRASLIQKSIELRLRTSQPKAKRIAALAEVMEMHEVAVIHTFLDEPELLLEPEENAPNVPEVWVAASRLAGDQMLPLWAA